MIETVLAASDTASATFAGTIFIMVIGVAFYFLPTAIGMIRKVRNIGSVIVINLFLGWTLVGWVVALAMAMRTNDKATS